MAWPNVVGIGSAAIVPAQRKASSIMGNITASLNIHLEGAIHLTSGCKVLDNRTEQNPEFAWLDLTWHRLA